MAPSAEVHLTPMESVPLESQTQYKRPLVGETEKEELSETTSLSKHDTWRPGFVSQFPITGLGALLAVLICSGAALIVLYKSNMKTSSQWPQRIAPNVILSVLNSVSALCITMAVGQGIAISWWRRALKGTTVEDLHTSWSFSSSFMAILTKHKFFNVMALAALCTKFAIIDSTLYQKATTQFTALGGAHDLVTYVYPTETFPTTGTLNGFGNATTLMTYPMTSDAWNWLSSSIGVQGNDLNGFGYCEGVCGVSYRGIGFSSSCTASNVSVPRSLTALQKSPQDNVLLGLDFQQRWPTAEKNYSYISVEWITWSSDSVDANGNPTANPQCNGQLYNLTCELRPAVIDYPVSMQNSSHSYRGTKAKYNDYMVYLGAINQTSGAWDLEANMDYLHQNQYPSFNVVSIIDVSEVQTAYANTSLGGIALALQTYYKSQATVSFSNESVSTSSGQVVGKVKPVVRADGLYAAFQQEEDIGDGCPNGYVTDYADMLFSINLLTFILSDDLYSRANWSDITYDSTDDYYADYTDDVARYVTAIQLKEETFYSSKLGYAWGAFASTVVVVILILPSYWGYWQLGRKVTMGPLEIANAFQAPAFSHEATGAGHVDGVLKAVGKHRVRYAAESHEMFGLKYGFRRADHVYAPPGQQV